MRRIAGVDAIEAFTTQEPYETCWQIQCDNEDADYPCLPGLGDGNYAFQTLFYNKTGLNNGKTRTCNFSPSASTANTSPPHYHDIDYIK